MLPEVDRAVKFSELILGHCSGTEEELAKLESFNEDNGGVGGHVQEHRVAKEVFASSIAGALADGIMYPMMTVKARLQVQGSGSQGSARTLYMYGGPLHAFQTIATKEGWRTFYKGASTILVGVPSTALYFSTYETIKRLFPGGQESPLVQFGGGIFASLGASIIDVPVEVIRQRQMVQTASEGSYTSVAD